MYDFRAPMATLGVPSFNRYVLSQNGVWHLPHGGAPVQHRVEAGDIFSETVGAVDELEFSDGQMWGLGQTFYETVAASINAKIVRLSLEMTEMEYETIHGTMYVDGGYIRAVLLVKPEMYGWAA